MPLLSIKNLSIGFSGRYVTDYAVEDVSFDLEPDEIPGLVGESDCGKSTNARMAAGMQSGATDAYLRSCAGQIFRSSCIH